MNGEGIRNGEFEDGDLLAAEYALGLLDGPERRDVERRMRRDEPLARRVEDWEARFAPMLTAVEPAEAPDEAWTGVESQLDRLARFRAPGSAGAAATPAGLVSRAWKWFGLGSFGLLAASLALLIAVTQPRVAEPPLAALIAPEGGPAIYTAVIDPRGARATLVPVAAGPDAAHSLELWAIAPSAAPRSLGLLPASGPAQVVISPELLVGGIVLAISREPVGGSPTGQPSGPVVGTGELRKV